MALITKIKQCVEKILANNRKRKQIRENIFLDRLSRENINVMEFDGQLYISCHGVPIVKTDDLKVNVPELLAQSRIVYLAWKKKFDK